MHDASPPRLLDFVTSTLAGSIFGPQVSCFTLNRVASEKVIYPDDVRESKVID